MELGQAFKEINNSQIDYEELVQINNERESILNDEIFNVEKTLKQHELEFYHRYGISEHSKVSSLLHKIYYNLLDEIDSLFIKAEYLDEISRNLILGEVEERIDLLKFKLSS